MQEVFSFAAEARGAIRHDAFTLSGSNFAAEVGFARFAEFAFAAFRGTREWLFNHGGKYEAEE